MSNVKKRLIQIVIDHPEIVNPLLEILNEWEVERTKLDNPTEEQCTNLLETIYRKHKQAMANEIERKKREGS